MAAISYVHTIGRVAEMLGEDEDKLQALADDMEPEDGCLFVLGTGEDEVMAFTSDGIEYLRELILDRKKQG